jgi:hypothetical protein
VSGFVAGALVLTALTPITVQAQDVDPTAHFAACVQAEDRMFEARLDGALNAPAAPNFHLVQGDEVASCGSIALTRCQFGSEQSGCRDAVSGAITAMINATTENLPEPATVAGRNPVWSDGLYPSLWARAEAGIDVSNCDETGALDRCREIALLLHFSDVMSLWQVARVIGAVEAAQ